MSARSRWSRVEKELVGAAVAALLLSGASIASANVVNYEGQGTDNSHVLVGFDLQGKHCPKSKKCMNHGKVKNLNAVSYPFPSCPFLLESTFDYPNDLPVHKGHFGGTASLGYMQSATVKGRFVHHGQGAEGWFEVLNGGCSTGQVHWTASRQ